MWTEHAVICDVKIWLFKHVYDFLVENWNDGDL